MGTWREAGGRKHAASEQHVDCQDLLLLRVHHRCSVYSGSARSPSIQPASRLVRGALRVALWRLLPQAWTPAASKSFEPAQNQANAALIHSREQKILATSVLLLCCMVRSISSTNARLPCFMDVVQSLAPLSDLATFHGAGKSTWSRAPLCTLWHVIHCLNHIV